MISYQGNGTNFQTQVIGTHLSPEDQGTNPDVLGQILEPVVVSDELLEATLQRLQQDSNTQLLSESMELLKGALNTHGMLVYYLL